MNIKKIIRSLYQATYARDYKAKDKLYTDIFNMHRDEWIDLTADEKKGIDKRFLSFYRIVKNTKGFTKENRDYYLTEWKYVNDLMPRLNPTVCYLKGKELSYFSFFTDKNYLDLFIPDKNKPVTLARCINGSFLDEKYQEITKEQVLDILNSYDKAVFKQTRRTDSGKGVALINQCDYSEKLKSFGKNFVVQKVIRQSPKLSYFNESSVNVVRITTVLWKGDIYYINSMFRVGAPGAFCDHMGHKNQKPLQIYIKEDGSFNSHAYETGTLIPKTDIFGKAFYDKLPKFDEMKKAAENMHRRFPDVGIIGWDFTLDENDDVLLIEFNVRYPGLISSQFHIGPIFMQKTPRDKWLLDEIMDKPLNYNDQPCL